ncbi:helix-turn-helix transcriptional regulator [Novosphingobium sp. ERN07]|nr:MULTISPECIES: AraC family transcriptional regulator [unclassified Novosphingobium]NLR41051.1 helix-turn-helix transcriptional regulator [Novosphingobium sp. ERW19]NLR70802.1 helix-turn-helix transcriptional regulator [Novosphingobium sp. ERN07]
MLVLEVADASEHLDQSAVRQTHADLVGVPPLLCLTALRIDMAAEIREREDYTVKIIAVPVGYGSEAAFNRAFVRYCGESPGRWRARRAPDAAGPSVQLPAA